MFHFTRIVCIYGAALHLCLFLIRYSEFVLLRGTVFCQPIKRVFEIWCDFDRASSLMCGNKMPSRWDRGFYCRSYCLLNMFRAPLCPSSGAQEYYTVVAACGISCCKNVKSDCKLGGICVLSVKCRVLSGFVTRCVECRGGCVWVFLVGFFVVYSLVSGSGNIWLHNKPVVFWPAEELLVYQVGWLSHFAPSLTSGRAVNMRDTVTDRVDRCQTNTCAHFTFNMHIWCAVVCRQQRSFALVFRFSKFPLFTL